MNFRKSQKTDIEEIMKIIHQAQNYFKNNNIDQWQNGYPNFQVINTDIEHNESYVLVKDSEIIATTVISFSGEKTYDKIYDGNWLTDNNKYAVIHRIAVKDNYKGCGLSHKILEYAENICLENNIHSIRIDTHEENIPMQNLLKRNQYKYCGIIYLDDGAKRIAFEKII